LRYWHDWNRQRCGQFANTNRYSYCDCHGNCNSYGDTDSDRHGDWKSNGHADWNTWPEKDTNTPTPPDASASPVSGSCLRN